MAPVTVLGKRAGPIESANKSMLDTELSATPTLTEPSSDECIPLILERGYHMPYQQQYQPIPTFRQAPFYPQSPPQDPLASPQSPVTDFGEKRRRVSGFPIPKSQQAQHAQQHPQQHPQQLMTPQTPNSMASMGTHAMPIPRQPLVNASHSASQRQARTHAKSQTSAATDMSAAPVASPPQVLPGMPFMMDPISRYAPPCASTAQTSTGLAPALTPTLAPLPTTMVTKPAVVPSMAYPPRQQRLPNIEATGTPPRKPWKPQEIILPKVVDVGPFTDCDDSGGHYVVRAGEWFAGRYLIIKLLGQGTFGKVAQAWDERTRQYCAIKIIRAVPKYRDASKIELRVLSLISSCDPAGRMRCVRMRECFDYRNHVCIVTDLHDISVYDFLKGNQFLPFPGHHIHHFAKQIISSIAYIHSLGLVHTDLKPENILLASSVSRQNAYRRKNSRTRRPVPRKELECTEVTLIDFGSAVFDDEYHSSVVSTRHYRAPEIILGTGWSFPCDMWSIGCLLVELCTGRVLFETRNDLEHLHMMERTLGTKFSTSHLSHMAGSSSSQAASLISSRTWPPKLNPLLEQSHRDAVENMQTISQLLNTYVGGSDRRFWDGFLDLVTRLMTLDPKQRITAQDALQHPWVVQGHGVLLK